jgi:formylglycine-generating enzyme required for sulfatase activity
MRRSISLVSLLAIIALLAFSSWLPANRSVSACQGKGGEVIAKPTPNPAPKKTTPPKKRSAPAKSTKSSSNTGSNSLSEIAFWETIKNSTDPEDFKAYLEQYPKGKFTALAKNRLKTLEASQPKPAATPNAAEQTTPTNTSGTNNKPNNSSGGNTTGSRTPAALPHTRTNQVGIEFILLPAGRFMMGSTNSRADEKPVHQVTISQPFYIGIYEVTQPQWQSVMGNNPSYFKACANCPVEQVSWDDAQNFINKLNENNDGFRYCLPTEAEWEYACRAGTTTEFSFGNSLSSDQANFHGNYPYGGAAKGVYRQKTTAVGSFAPNAFGLYDMHGNVWEWCQDWYHPTYDGAPGDGSAWLSGGEKYRVLRGGSWSGAAAFLRSANRLVLDPPGDRYYTFGFRLVAVVRTQ